MRSLIFFLFIPSGFYAQHIINKRRRAEMKAKQISRQLDQILNTAVDGMRLIDKNFNTLKINETLSKLIGIDKDEDNKKCYEVFSGDLCHGPNCPH